MTTEATINKENQKIKTLQASAETASSLGTASSIGAIAAGLAAGSLPPAVGLTAAVTPMVLPVLGLLASTYFLKKKLGYEEKIEALKQEDCGIEK